MPPPIQESDTPRPRLLHRLTGALDEPWTLTLVSAPAGSGKTRLLTQWAHELQSAGTAEVAWLTIERWDDDLALLRAALSRIDDAGLRAQLARVPNTQSAASARLLGQALGAASRPIVVIVDDVHWISSRELGEALATFARAVPGNAHVVLSGRGMATVPIARARVTGLALEITSTDIAFTADEVRAYLAARGARATQGEIAAILRRTEGWVTALRLMELSALDGADEMSTLIHGETPIVADYFLEELFADLDDDVRDFLVRTSVPDAFTTELAQTLTDGTARTLIDRLARQNVLFDQRGSNPTWYHYHPLLREFLRSRLEELGPDTIESIERVCAEWFAARQEYLPALQHAAHTADPLALAVILRRCGLQLILMGYADDVIEATAQMPAPMREDPAVQMLLAAAELARGDESPAAGVLAALRGASGNLSEEDQFWQAGLELNTAIRRGGIEEAVARLQASNPTASGEPQLDAYVYLQASMGELYIGRLDGADQWAQLALDNARAAGLVTAELQALAVLAANALYRGRMRDVMARSEQADERWRAMGEPVDMFYQGTRLWRGWILYERMRTEEARAVIAAAAPVVIAGREPAIARGARGMLALMGADSAPEPARVAEEIVELLGPRPDLPLPPHWAAMAGMPVVHTLNRLGQPGLRDRFLRVVAADIPGTGDLAVMNAIAALHDTDLGRAREELSTVLDGTRPCLWPGSLTQAWLAEAALDAHHGHAAQAQTALAAAIDLAADEGHLRPFHDAGPIIGQLLAARATASSRTPFADTVRAMLIAEGVVADEELTERELIVLRALSRDATMRDIAQQEYISMNTVKTHVRNIYRKLGVSDRESATAAAHALGID